MIAEKVNLIEEKGRKYSMRDCLLEVMEIQENVLPDFKLPFLFKATVR